MRLLRVSVISMAVLCLMLLVGSLIGGINHNFIFYKNPVFLAVVFLCLVWQIICIVTCKFRLKKIGYYICHIGVLLLAIGAFVGFVFAKNANFSMPVGGYTTYREVQMEDGSVTNFGFSIAVSKFRLHTYDGTDEHKQYDATFQIYDKEYHRENVLSINHPITYKGWKFYLMSYDTQTSSSVSLYAKNDPGNLLLLFGFIAVDIGTAMLCFSALKRKEKKGGTSE